MADNKIVHRVAFEIAIAGVERVTKRRRGLAGP
jgi:hypothetical protein